MIKNIIQVVLKKLSNKFFIKFIDFIKKRDLRIKWNFYVKWWDSLLKGSIYVSPYAKFFFDYCLILFSLLSLFICLYVIYFVTLDIFSFFQDYDKVKSNVKMGIEFEISSNISKENLKDNLEFYVQREEITKEDSYLSLKTIGFGVLIVSAGIIIIIIKILSNKD
jgi:hypothetical protein